MIAVATPATYAADLAVVTLGVGILMAAMLTHRRRDRARQRRLARKLERAGKLKPGTTPEGD